MLATCSGNRLSLVLGLVIQYLSGEDTFSGRVCSRVIILNSNSGGVVVGGRLGRTTAHRSHANTPYSWRIPPSRQGFIVLFCFIHKGRCFHLFQWVFGAVGGCLPVLAGFGGFWSLSGGVEGGWRVLRGVGRPLSVPKCFRFRHVNQAGLRL